MNPVLTYNPQILSYSVPPSESERKGAMIADINTIQKELGKEPVDECQFEMLMNKSLKDLEEIINDQAALLTRVSVKPWF